jgi:hypothetical protein
MIVLADKGLAGRELEGCAEDPVKVLLVRPGRKDERRRFGNLGGMRQWAESVCPQKPARSRTPRRPHPSWRVHPHRPAPARPRCLHLA